MDVLLSAILQIVLTALGGVATFFASKLGAFLGKWLKQKEEDDLVKKICHSCVLAVEQMYRDCGGEMKLEKALEMGEKLLGEKGIVLSAETLRFLLEAALAEAKGAFDRA